MGATDAVAEVNAIAVGVKVWLPDGGEEAYISGEVTSIEGDKVTVQIPGAGDKVVPAADCSLCEKATQEDMVKLNYLHEPGVLNNLQSVAWREYLIHGAVHGAGLDPADQALLSGVVCAVRHRSSRHPLRPHACSRA